MNARLVLWAGAADAAAAVRQLCPQAAADALARAGEICGHTFLFRDHWEMEPTREPVHFDGPVVWDAVPAGDPEWIYALNRHTIFVNLGKAWQYTGQARYLDAFVSLLEDWLDRVPRTPASENTIWRALEAGLRPENWLRALGLFGQAVPAPLCRRIDESLARHGAYLAEAHGPFQRLSNWGAIQSHGLFLIGLWLGRADWQELALGRLAGNGVPGAGGQRQLHPPRRLGKRERLCPLPRREPGGRPRARGPAPHRRIPRRGGRPDRPRSPDLCGRGPSPDPERPRRPQHPPAGRRGFHRVPGHLGVGPHRPAFARPGTLCPAGGLPCGRAPGLPRAGRGGGATAGRSQAAAAGVGGPRPRPGRAAPPGRAILPLWAGRPHRRGGRRLLAGGAHLRPAALAQRAAGRVLCGPLCPRLQPPGRSPGPPAGSSRRRGDGPALGAQPGRPL